MPKETFFNLKESKREKIEQALINEFSRGSFEKASISNIVAEAEIPRGSFYQYFEDKEDAVKYIIGKFIKVEHEKINELLIKTNKDIFEATLRFYDCMIEEANNENLRLIRNILQELRKNNTSIFEIRKEMRHREKISELINIENLKIEKEDDVEYFLKILTIVTRSVASEVVTRKISKEEGKETLIRNIEILKRGMAK